MAIGGVPGVGGPARGSIQGLDYVRSRRVWPFVLSAVILGSLGGAELLARFIR